MEVTNMSDSEQKRIFQKNLLKYMSSCDKTQKEIADAIGVSPQTFNTWCQGIALPRMGKVQLLADYFHINKSDLIEEKDDSPNYYYDNETREIAQEIFENPDLKSLFDMSRKMPPDRLKAHIEFMKKLQDS